MNTDEICYVLTKRPIPPGQLSLYRILYSADQWVTMKTITGLMREWDQTSERGVLGALSHRIGPTEESPRYLALLERRLNKEGIYEFQMRRELRKAIDSLPKVRAVMDLSVREIHETYDKGRAAWLVAE